LTFFSPPFGAGSDHNSSDPIANLMVQEALYGGAKGVSRKQDPVTVGLPLADSAAITSESQLGLSGASAGQFRVLGRWPSGNVRWVLVDTLADVSAGKGNTAISLTRGSGNFGGPNLATDGTSAITISTGTANFVVRKKNFDLIDQASVNDHQLVLAGMSRGLTLMGPSPNSTVCPCSTVYSSSSDSDSTAVIEENGPVRAVVRATGVLKDVSGHGYMRFGARLHFFKGKNQVKIVVLLQNADYGASNSFASAYKGFSSFEARLSPNLGSGKTFAFGTSNSPATGSISGADNSYLYQAYSDKMEHPQWASPDTRALYAPRSYIKRTLAEQKGSQRTWNYNQEGYVVVHGDSTLAKGAQSDYSAGWADLTDSTGAGVEVGTYQAAAYWPKALQFMNGGNEIRIGIWPDQTLFGHGAQPYYQSWPQYSMHTIYLNFHDSSLSDADAEFEKLQFPVIARAPASYYNQTKALLYPLVDPPQEDRYLQALGVACCIADVDSPYVYRTYSWRAAGAGNQAEMRWSDLMLWLQRGFTGRYMDASHFYTFQVEQVFPRSDYLGSAPFSWRDRPDSELDFEGLPESISSLNSDKDCDPGEVRCGRNWIDSAHAHWYGMIDYYWLTGDENIQDAIVDGASDLYGNPKVRDVANGTYWNSRNIGEALMSDARLAKFYEAIGDDAHAKDALAAGNRTLATQVWPELNVLGYGSSTQGVSRTRGAHYGCCPATGTRVMMPFQAGILSEGLWEFMQAEGPQWPQYNLTFDLAYGLASWSLNEMWQNNGTGTGCKAGSGPAYEIDLDHSNPSLEPSCSETLWFNFYNFAKYTGDPKLWAGKFAQYIEHLNANGGVFSEYGTIFENAVISEVLKPEPQQLKPVPVNAQRNSDSTYVLTWTVPQGARSYRIKCSTKNIVEWLKFDPKTNTFAIDPANNEPWFAATNISNPPAPGPPGSVQMLKVSGLDSNVPWHFAMKAYVGTSVSK